MQERLRKIYQLSVRGIAGERETAQRLLQSLLDKHGLTISDIADEERSDRKFKYNTAQERRLLIQIFAKVLGSTDFKVWGYTYHLKTIGISATNAEFIEMSILFEDHKLELKKQMQRLFSAFVQANKLFPPANKDNRPALTDEEIAELRKVLQMAQAIEPTPVTRRRLSEGRTVSA